MKRNIMNNEQLELGLKQPVLRITLRRKRASRAKWWFEQMRNAVDCAIDWRAETPGTRAHSRLMPGRGSSML